MCPGPRDMWGIYGIETLHVSGAEEHVGRRGRCWVEAVWRFGGIVAGLLWDCCGIVVTIRKSIRLFSGAGRRLGFWLVRLARWVISVKMTREESIEFYKTYSRKLFNVSFRIVGDSALAEEIMQDTVLKFFRFVEEGEMADRGGGDSSLALRMTGGPLRMTKEPLRMTDVAGRKAIEAWLVRTCVRGSIDALRRLKREREFLGEYETWQGSAAEVGQESSSGESGRITVEEVKKAMDALPSPYRLILTLVLIDGLDYEEISEITGEKEGALRTRFSRARKMLAERLREGR